MSNELGTRGRIPRYKFGRYGPHNNDALFASNGPVAVNCKVVMTVQSKSRISKDMMKYGLSNRTR